MNSEYEQFVEELRAYLLDELNLPEDKIRYQKAGTGLAKTDDCLVVEYAKKGNTKEICSINIREVFERSKKNEDSIEDVKKDLCKEIRKMMDAGYYKQMKKLEKYEKAKSQLFIRLLNADENREKISGGIYRVVGDIAQVVYIGIFMNSNQTISSMVPNVYLERWNMEAKEVLDNALLNTYYLTPPRIYRWEKMIFEPEYTGDHFMNVLRKYEIQKGMVGNCLSTTFRTNGAVAIFLPGVADRLCYLLDSSLYLVFTSIHEVMVHAEETVYPEDLKNILQETLEESTPEDEVLTRNIYHYDRETKSFRCVM